MKMGKVVTMEEGRNGRREGWRWVRRRRRRRRRRRAVEGE
jgi:hypothetical protein